MKLLLVFIMFFLLVAFFIISENKLALKEEENRGEFQKLYFAWLSETFEDIKGFTGYVIKFGWLPDS